MSYQAQPFSVRQDLRKVATSIASNNAHLIAVWTAEGLACYDTEAWAKAEVHASASDEVMAGGTLHICHCNWQMAIAVECYVHRIAPSQPRMVAWPG